MLGKLLRSVEAKMLTSKGRFFRGKFSKSVEAKERRSREAKKRVQAEDKDEFLREIFTRRVKAKDDFSGKVFFRRIDA